MTPLALQRDSRTFKQAASVARLGFESVVVEGEPSRFPRDGLPFELTTGEIASGGSAARRAGEHRLRRFLRWAGRTLPGGPIVGRVKRAVEPFYFMGWFLVAYGPRTARRLPPASLYYLHSFRQFPGVWLRARRDGTPFIYDAHDFYPVSRDVGTAPTHRDRLVNRFLLAVEKRCVARATEVVTVGQGVADLMERQFGRRPLVIRNCHDRRIDTELPAGLRAALDLPGDAFVVVAAGNAKEGAATTEAIEAMLLLPERVRLVFLGAGYEEYGEAIERRGLTGRVHRVPPVAPTEVVPFIAGADLALIPYFALSPAYLPSLPNRFFSAVAAGLPLLYPASLPELAGTAQRYELGLPIDPRDPASLAGAVERLLDDPELLERYRASTSRASKELSWENEESRLAAAIESALGRRSGSAG